MGLAIVQQVQVKASVKVMIVPLWAALLFGGFQLEREGNFYEGRILLLGQTEAVLAKD